MDEKFENHYTFINDVVGYVKLYKWIISEINTDRISNDNSNDKEINKRVIKKYLSRHKNRGI